MNTDVKLKVSEIQRFCMHDGPGVRTTVFLKGCPMRCAWCHNPEMQKNSSELLFYSQKCIYCGACTEHCSCGAHSFGEDHTIDRNKCGSCFSCTESCFTGALEVCGKDMSIEEILSIVDRDKAFYGEKGGVTISGGEPFLQGDATLSILRACKARGLSTAVETCGYADAPTLIGALPYVDLFLWDIKDTNEARHKSYTGVSNELILKNLKAVNELGGNIRLRCIIVNGVNTDTEHYKKIAELAHTVKNFDGVEFIPYHAYAGTKAKFIGLEDSGKAEWIPTAEQIEDAKKVLRDAGVAVFED